MMFDLTTGEMTIRVEVEGQEPLEVHRVPEEGGAPFDLVGRRLPGGTEVTVTVTEYIRVVQQSFVIDGDVMLRLRFADPGSESKLVFERLM